MTHPWRLFLESVVGVRAYFPSLQVIGHVTQRHIYALLHHPVYHPSVPTPFAPQLGWLSQQWQLQDWFGQPPPASSPAQIHVQGQSSDKKKSYCTVVSYALVDVNPHPPPTLGKGGALALMTCKKGKIPHLLGQNDWSKPPLKPPQFINYCKRTKPKFAKPPPPGACSLDKFPLMPHLCPTFPRGGKDGGGGGFTLTSAFEKPLRKQ